MSPTIAMKSAGRALKNSPSATIVGVLLGVMIALWWNQIEDWVARIYDSVHPVAVGHTVVLNRSAETIIFSLRISRNRECQYGPPPHAYIELPTGDLVLAKVERVDGIPPGVSYPRGSTYYSGIWQISPILGAVRARMVARYDCGGRASHSVIADIAL